MDISVFLSKALGLYLLVVGSGLLINPKVKSIFIDIMNNQGLLYITDFMALILGILMITSHNIWEADWKVIITIIGWVMFARGALRVVFPHLGNKMILKWLECNVTYYTTIVLILAAGAVLYYTGCAHSQLQGPM